MRIWKEAETSTARYNKRTQEREVKLMTSTMNFVGYFISLGDDQPTAESKVSQVSTEVASLLYVYTLGNTQPLKDAIQNIDENVLTFMNQSAKTFLINELSI